MAIAWLIHLVLYRYHGDAFNYTALLYVPILFLIWWKPPTKDEAWSAISVFAWTVSIVLVGTRILESAGLLQVRNQTDALIAFDSERYFLPLNALVGIDGRWYALTGINTDPDQDGRTRQVTARETREHTPTTQERSRTAHVRHRFARPQPDRPSQ